MSKYKRRLIKGTNWALAGLLSLLGFTRCGLINPADEYGTPWSSYAIKGAVTDKVTGEPVKDIEVKIAIPDSITPYYSEELKNSWKTTTNGEGEFKLSDTPESYLQEIPIVASDIDGAKNGLYQSDTIYVDYKGAIQTEKGKGWYNGEFTKTIQIQLEEEKPDE
ncbi:MAG: radical SAM-associated putative lipoprotein [Tannerella sp.]|jgi:putative lipoprotein (rSAM/lipoprotein system)|nr:radical SAM-associated putative lipoprotein [Tannerella sp.]